MSSQPAASLGSAVDSAAGVAVDVATRTSFSVNEKSTKPTKIVAQNLTECPQCSAACGPRERERGRRVVGRGGKRWVEGVSK